MRLVMTLVHPNITDVEFEKLFSQMDRDRNGSVSETEFVQVTIIFYIFCFNFILITFHIQYSSKLLILNMFCIFSI